MSFRANHLEFSCGYCQCAQRISIYHAKDLPLRNVFQKFYSDPWIFDSLHSAMSALALPFFAKDIICLRDENVQNLKLPPNSNVAFLTRLFRSLKGSMYVRCHIA